MHRYVAQFRRWLDERAGGVPTPYPASAPLPALETRKEVVLDRWHQHTKHCAACMRVRLMLALTLPPSCLPVASCANGGSGTTPKTARDVLLVFGHCVQQWVLTVYVSIAIPQT